MVPVTCTWTWEKHTGAFKNLPKTSGWQETPPSAYLPPQQHMRAQGREKKQKWWEHTSKRLKRKQNNITSENQIQCHKLKIPKTVSPIPPWDFIQSLRTVQGHLQVLVWKAWHDGVVNTLLIRTQQIQVRNTHVFISTHLRFYFCFTCIRKFLCRTMFWLMQDGTLSWQVGRKLKIILSPGFKWSER